MYRVDRMLCLKLTFSCNNAAENHNKTSFSPFTISLQRCINSLKNYLQPTNWGTTKDCGHHEKISEAMLCLCYCCNLTSRTHLTFSGLSFVAQSWLYLFSINIYYVLVMGISNRTDPRLMTHANKLTMRTCICIKLYKNWRGLRIRQARMKYPGQGSEV